MLLTDVQTIMECLLGQDATTVFGYPDGAVLSTYDALYEYRDKIDHIETLREQGAVHVADGYARTSGKTGVCLATSGLGATNLVTGIAIAYMDSVPAVAITGNVNPGLPGLDSFQEVDIMGITTPVTKHNFIVKDVSDLVSTLREVFRIVQSGRRGPVLTDIPKDVTAHKCEFISQKPNHPIGAPALPNENRFQQAVELLWECQRPFVYAGGGVIASEASDVLRELSERPDAPVSCPLMCQGGLDQTDERYLDMLGTHGTAPSALALKECDVLVAVGTRFSDHMICNADLFVRGCRAVHIDIDSAEFNKNIYADLCLKGDARAILQVLNSRLETASHPEQTAQIKAWQRGYPLSQKAVYESDVTPQYLLETPHHLAGDQLIPSIEVGQHQMWTTQFCPFKVSRRMITPSGLGIMSFGLSAALDMQAARPGLWVVNAAGDGNLRMNCAELSTVAKHNIPVIGLIVNNNVLGMVRQWQKLFYDGHFSRTTLNKATSYKLLVEALGVKAFIIRTCQDVEPVLRQALDYQGPSLINRLVDSDMNVLSMAPADSAVEEAILEIDEKGQQQ